MTVTLIGGGGAKFVFDLPLRQVIAEQFEKGALQPETAKDREALTQPSADPTLLGAGTVIEILEWVGEDPERAADALDAERLRDKPRSTLIASLEEIGD